MHVRIPCYLLSAIFTWLKNIHQYSWIDCPRDLNSSCNNVWWINEEGRRRNKRRRRRKKRRMRE
jgi:hypothetical protein